MPGETQRLRSRTQDVFFLTFQLQVIYENCTLLIHGYSRIVRLKKGRVVQLLPRAVDLLWSPQQIGKPHMTAPMTHCEGVRTLERSILALFIGVNNAFDHGTCELVQQ